MTETPFFFGPDGGRLFGVLHAPDDESAGRTFVFCHALTEEKLWTHRVSVSFARLLASRGDTVLRFDYRGNGDSDGGFDLVSLTTLREDVLQAIDEARRRNGAQPVTLLGLRAGATLAGLVAEDAGDRVERLILWAPVVNGARYLQDLLRINLTTQMAAHKEILYDREALVEQMKQGRTVNVDGYEMSYPLYEQLSAVNLAEAPKRFAGPCLIVQIERRTRPDAELQQLAASYGQATYASAEEEPFWKEIARFYEQAPSLFQATQEWLA